MFDRLVLDLTTFEPATEMARHRDALVANAESLAWVLHNPHTPVRLKQAADAMLARLIEELDASEVLYEDLESEPIEDCGDYEPTDAEDSCAPATLNTDRLPPRRICSWRRRMRQSALIGRQA